MWGFILEGSWTLQHFFGTTHEGMWRLFFGKRRQWPDTTEDVGLDCNHPDTPVSSRLPNTSQSDTQWQDTDRIILFQGWIKKVQLIRCPAPLPEDSATPVLARMLASAPYQASTGEGEKAQDDLGSGGKSDTESKEFDLSSPEDGGRKGPSVPSPNRRKRATSEDEEGRSFEKGKMPPLIGLGLESDAVEQLRQGDQPSAKP